MSETTPVFYGVITDGKINLEDRGGFSDLIHALEGRRIALHMWERFDPNDIAKLRSYFHGFVLPSICKASGEPTDPKTLARIKDGLKERFLTIPTAPGEPVQVRSTESLSPSEYYHFIFECRQYAAEVLHTDIEDPK